MTLTRVNTNGITDGTIVDADVSGSAAIAGTKVNPDFGSQNTTTTGTSTAASFIPTGSSVPANGVYLPGANALGLSTNSTERIRVTSGGLVGIGTTSPAYALDIQGSQGVGLQIYETSSGINRRLRITQESSGVTYDATYSSTGNTHRWLIGGSEAARLDGSGRLLVGTSSSRGTWFTTSGQDSAIQVETTATQNFLSGVYNGNESGGSYFLLGKSRGTTAGAVTVVQNGDALGAISFQGTDGTKMVEGARIQAFVDNTPGTNDMPGRLRFSVTRDGSSSPTEALTISNQGQAAFTAAYSDNWGVVMSTTTGNQYNLLLSKSADQNTTNEDYVRGSGGGTTRFRFVGNGGLYNYSGNNSNLSDEREKKNIENLDSTWDCLKHWELKKFHYNEDPDDTDKRYGVIAQQVGEYCPEVLTDWIKQEAAPAKFDDNGNEIEPAREEIARIGVKEQQMMWMAIKALQEAQLRIETLEAEVAALKGA